MATEHHERFNGKGYPYNLQGSNLSKVGQMMSIVDVYDAMTSSRGYRRAISPSEALIELLSRMDKEFHGDLVQRFVQSIGIYPFGTLVSLVNGFVGVVIDVKRKSLLQPVLRVIIENKNRISPYDIDLKNYESDPNYRTAGIESLQKLFLSQSELNNILKMDVSKG